MAHAPDYYRKRYFIKGDLSAPTFRFGAFDYSPTSNNQKSWMRHLRKVGFCEVSEEEYHRIIDSPAFQAALKEWQDHLDAIGFWDGWEGPWPDEDAWEWNEELA